jgi:hypothetical protein
MGKNKNSIGQVLVYFTCNNCGIKTKPFGFEVFEDKDGKADLDRLSTDVNKFLILCVNCGKLNFSADIKINNRVLNYPN